MSEPDEVANPRLKASELVRQGLVEDGSTDAVKEFNQKLLELSVWVETHTTNLILRHLTLMANNTRENGYIEAAEAIDDMIVEIKAKEHID